LLTPYTELGGGEREKGGKKGEREGGGKKRCKNNYEYCPLS